MKRRTWMYRDLQGQSYEKRKAAGLIHHNFKDLTGQKFGELTAVKPLYSTGKTWVWLYQCSCGTFLSRTGKYVSKTIYSGVVPACRTCTHRRLQEQHRTHGLSRHPLYAVWRAMMDRCRLSTKYCWARYGGRGIFVCEAWRTFEGFYAWAKTGYKKGLLLDRIDDNGNYCPENCRWTTYKVNSRNRPGVYAEIDVAELAKATGISKSTLHYRIQHGWPIELLTTPPDSRNARLRAYKVNRQYQKKYMTSSTAAQDTGSLLREVEDQ